MFVGHFGVGLAGKTAAPRASLGTLFLAAQFVDLLWPTLLALGVERVAIEPGITVVTPLDFVHYPISHSLLAVLGWGLLLALTYYAVRRYPPGAILAGALVVSHWLLDAVTHRPDLPLFPGGEARIGLGLWNSLPGTFAVELGIFALGVWFYVRCTRAVDRIGAVGFWALVGFLLLVYVGNVFGEPPPSVAALAWVAQAQWLIILWGYWVDRHRQAV